MLCNIASLQVHPLKFSELISYSLVACILQPECYKVGCLLPSWINNLPPTLMAPSDPGVSRHHVKSLQIQISFQYLKNQKMLPPGHQQVSKWHLKPFLWHQIAESVKKVKSFKNHCIYSGLGTSSLWILASFPSLDHQKEGPGNCLPLWPPKS